MRQSFDYGIRARAGESLSLDAMRARIPAIFAEHAHESRIDRYVYVSTLETMQAMMANGFLPVEARLSRSRDEGRRGFGKHLIRFRRDEQLPAARRVGDVSFEIILRNAHDGGAAYNLMAGLFRLVCLNGMVVSDGNVGEVHVRHSGNRDKQITQVVEGAYSILDSATLALEAPKTWSTIALNRDEQMAMAEGAHTLRFADSHGEVKTAIQPAQLLHARRPQDTDNNLWTTFNRIQENTIRGGISAIGRDAQGHVRRSTTREVRGIDGDVKLNKALWTLAARMAEIKQAG